VGFFVNSFAPARVGEVIRAFTLSKKTVLGKTQALSTIIVERLSDVIAVVVLLFFGLFFSAVYSQKIWGIALLVLGACLVVLLVFLFNKKVFSVGARFLFWTPKKVKGILKDLMFASDSLKSSKSLWVWFWSFVIWFLYAGLYFYLLFSLGVNLGFASAVVIAMTLSLSTMIPSGPGYLGTFELATVFVFQLFGLDINTAVSFAIISRLVMHPSLVLMGVFSLRGLALSFSDLKLKKD
jgi:hypothetical protein